MGGNYKRCDCCGHLKAEDQLEEVTITIKKCKDCDLSKLTEQIVPLKDDSEPKKERPELKTLGNPYKTPPPSVREAFQPPPV